MFVTAHRLNPFDRHTPPNPTYYTYTSIIIITYVNIMYYDLLTRYRYACVTLCTYKCISTEMIRKPRMLTDYGIVSEGRWRRVGEVSPTHDACHQTQTDISVHSPRSLSDVCVCVHKRVRASNRACVCVSVLLSLFL